MTRWPNCFAIIWLLLDPAINIYVFSRYIHKFRIRLYMLTMEICIHEGAMFSGSLPHRITDGQNDIQL